MIINNLICDRCNQHISTLEEGYVEWLRNINTGNLTEFHIVHNTSSCLYNEQEIHHEFNAAAPGNHLQYFLGIDGLIRLLNIIDNDKTSNKTEVIEIIKRVQVPGYEASKPFLDEACSRGIIDQPNDSGSYFPHTSHIEEINNLFNSRE